MIKRSPSPDEPVAAVDEPVDVLDLAARATPAVLVPDDGKSAPERDAIASERRKQSKTVGANAVDVGSGAE